VIHSKAICSNGKIKMTKKPETISIIQNDTWAAPSVGMFFSFLFMTGVVFLVDTLTHGTMRDEADPITFMWMTAASFVLAIAVIFWRIWYVTETFQNGVEVKAQIINVRSRRGGMTLRVKFTRLGQTQETEIDQAITSRAKKLLSQKEITLVINQAKPKNILIKEVYL
jgi:hypothetical protein